MNDYTLGPPIRPIPVPEVETVEATTRPGVWKVGGKYQTWIEGNEQANVQSSPAVDFYLDFVNDPEFPVAQWGSF